MKNIPIAVFIAFQVTACSFGGFKPPPPVDIWGLRNVEKYFNLVNSEEFFEYQKKRSKDMRACGIDPVIGDSHSAKSSLCMESKGWYERKGPVCGENSRYYDDPLCVQWRAKHKR